MRAPEIEPDRIQQVPIEEERRTGFIGLAVLVGLLVLLGVQGSWSMSAFVLALVVIIFLHELGHYLTAKWAGMKVTEFFIGFGPRLWSFQRGETEYGIKAIPAGAYVRVIGMSNLDEVEPEDEARTYRAKPYWRRMSVAVAGSTMHFILAFLLMFGILVGHGTERDIETDANWSISEVSSDQADAAGLRPGDRIVAIDGERYDVYTEVSEELRSRPGEAITLTVVRDGEERDLEATLASHRPGESSRVGFLGIAAQASRDRANPLEAIPETFGEMGSAAKDSVAGLGKLFSPSGVSRYVDNLTGTDSSTVDSPGAEVRPSSPIGIVRAGGQLAEHGIVNVLALLFFFNMFIGIFNLTPLLPFDGGHVVIATYEKVRSMISGRRYQADVAKLMPLTYAVVMVLALLFVTSMYLDIFEPLDIG